MSDDIVERLRAESSPNKYRGTALGFAAMDAANEIERLRADARQRALNHITTKWELMDAQMEIERLRSLITAWADTHYEDGPFSVAHQNAIDALRAEVDK